MSFKKLFFPHPHHNHKPRLLHHAPLAILIALFLSFQIALGLFSRAEPTILGYSSVITPQQIIDLTNQVRQNQNLSPLKENAKLTQAAKAKAQNMFGKDYWAHVAPDGTQPWFFVLNAGYRYLHAGENLARDFRDAGSVVTAWQNSPNHNANLTSSKYQDIGVAVIDGTLNGHPTTLVVQMLGTAQQVTAQVASPAPTPPPVSLVSSVLAEEAVPISPSNSPAVSPFDISRSISLAFLILITITLAIDWLVVWRRNIVRISGKTWAHLTFMATLIIIIIILKQGLII